MRLPDFFIVGHAKSGTTALYEMLRGHPQIYMPDVKEPWFFATDLHSEPSRTRWGTFDDYTSLFDPAQPEQRVGEASVFYLWSQTAAARIAQAQPNARIIAVLREPASFLRSLHLQFVKTHIESKADLRTAIALESARREGREVLRSPYSPALLVYSDHVRYVEQLRRYRELFPADQILVLIYDDLVADNAEAVRTVLRFLDVDDSHEIAVTTANPSVRVRSAQLHAFVRRLYMGDGPASRSAKAAIKMLTSQSVRHRALEVTQRRVLFGQPRPADRDLMTELRRRFKPEVVALSEQLGRDLVRLWGYDSLD
jgi:Sulfotransferase domain